MSAKEADSYTIIPPRSFVRVMLQSFWLIMWPLLTIVMVIGAVYLDRMDKLKELTIQREQLLLAAAGQSMVQQGALVASDLRYLSDSLILRRYLRNPNPAGKNQVRSLLAQVLERQPEYLSIRVSNRATNDLLVQDHRDSTHDLFNNNGGFDDELFDMKRLFSSHGSVQIVYSEAQNTRQHAGAGDSSPTHLQFTTGLVNEDGSTAGYITIVYRSDGLLLQKEQTIGGVYGSLYLRDRRGHYLMEPDGPEEGDKPGRADSCFSEILGNDTTEFWRQLIVDGKGHQDCGDRLFVFSHLRPFAGRLFTTIQAPSELPGSHKYRIDQRSRWALISEIPTSYFAEQRYNYLQFMGLVGVALMVPSIFVCLFLARARERVRLERILRFEQQQRHLDELEQKVQARTRELDDKNLQLSGEIAERLNAEKQLKSANDLLSGMLQSIDGIIYVADMESHEILFANDYLKKLFGFEPVGKQCWQFLHASQQGPCEFCNNDALIDSSGVPAQPQFWEYQNPFNKRWYAAKDQVIKWSDGRFVRLEIALDITEQKRIQHFLEEARKQAELTTGTRGKFVALVAHDLKSPFFSITQMIKRILDRETFDHKVHRQFLENIVENGHRMLQMIDNLLSLDRLETGDIKLARDFFDVKVMVDEVLGNFQHAAFEKGIRIENRVDSESHLYADQYLYFVILNNLVSNAIKFSDRGGHIKLYQPDGSRRMSVAVRDDGRGMSEPYVKDLFRADVKTSRRGTGGEKGSGLGLIFCQEIIRAHGGEIRVESKRNEGTIFIIELPECCKLEQG
ncbi:MAG: PAS domain-containing sensor histidine kinase [Desulfobulbaceae bacterium]|nr:MAG: PAS domain-containing sensor histidine kinase [Desulfobulbaceae bacterium]